jgi:hypothetical protein
MRDAGMGTVPRPRGMLLEFLEDHLKRAPPLPSEANRQKYLLRCLREAQEGLHALDYGEVHPILAPKKTNDKGATPYSAKKFRMIALGFVDLLRKKGYKAGKARAKVGIAYGVGRSTIKDWRKKLGKTGDFWMQQFRKEIADSTDWDDLRVLEELSEAAKKYLIANEKKKREKKPKKKPVQKQKDDSRPHG